MHSGSVLYRAGMLSIVVELSAATVTAPMARVARAEKTREKSMALDSGVLLYGTSCTLVVFQLAMVGRLLAKTGGVESTTRALGRYHKDVTRNWKVPQVVSWKVPQRRDEKLEGTTKLRTSWKVPQRRQQYPTK